MTRTSWIAMSVLVLLLGVFGGCTKDGGLSLSFMGIGEDDETVTLDQCPEAVRETINAHLDGGTIREIERTTDHGEVLFEVDVEHADRVVEFDVAEDGTFRGYEDDEEGEGGDEDDGDD